MLRILIVFALMLPGLADAQARGLGSPFRTAEKSASSSTVIDYGKRDGIDRPAAQAAPAATITSAPSFAVPSVMKTVDRTAHWCDNGSIVGSGVGFCVVKIRASDPS